MPSLRRLFICFPAQSVSDGDRRNEPHLPSSLLYSRRVDGVLQPRVSKEPFLEGNVLLLEAASMNLNLHCIDVVPPSPQNPIATLAHGLDRVLFKCVHWNCSYVQVLTWNPSPGVQWLQDPRSQVYGFTTWLEKIIPVKNFAFERLPPFLPSSRDQVRNLNHPFTRKMLLIPPV
jgi:hypothetical protein